MSRQLPKPLWCFHRASVCRSLPRELRRKNSENSLPGMAATHIRAICLADHFRSMSSNSSQLGFKTGNKVAYLHSHSDECSRRECTFESFQQRNADQWGKRIVQLFGNFL